MGRALTLVAMGLLLAGCGVAARQYWAEVTRVAVYECPATRVCARPDPTTRMWGGFWDALGMSSVGIPISVSLTTDGPRARCQSTRGARWLDYGYDEAYETCKTTLEDAGYVRVLPAKVP